MGSVDAPRNDARMADKPTGSVGELVRQGQAEGTVLRQGQRQDPLRVGDLAPQRVLEAMGVGAMADTPADQFDVPVDNRNYLCLTTDAHTDNHSTCDFGVGRGGDGSHLDALVAR